MIFPLFPAALLTGLPAEAEDGLALLVAPADEARGAATVFTG